METLLLQTKLYIPSLRSSLVPRPHLVAKLSREKPRKLILLSAPAGYGKTTLVTEWLAQDHANTPVSWLSLDEDDSDTQQFFSYLAAAVQHLPDVQSSLPQLLQSPQPPSAKKLVGSFINDIDSVSAPFLLILDDYHAFESSEIDMAMAFLLDHMPLQMTLLITSRTDPGFPISRLRARGEMTELRISDLRFTEAETVQFLQESMNITLSTSQIAALENRVEGWIAGLQMIALSLQNQDDVAGFVEGFTGSHRFIMDYPLEEVLNQLPADVQSFLLKTALLSRLCADLCDAVRQSPPPSQKILEELENRNIFIIPLDDERRWYRYHHLFADLLRQRLHQSTATPPKDGGIYLPELHKRASQWFEENGLDIERAERLIAGKGMPLPLRGAASPVLNWLASLPADVLDARPSLWVTYAFTLTFTGQAKGAEEKLQAAEAILKDVDLDEEARDLIGQIASIRAMLAISRSQIETIIAQSHRALEYLHPDNLAVRTSTTWALGYAYQLQGDRAAARQAYAEVIAISEESGNSMFILGATISLGQVQEAENQLHLAAETYRRVLQLAGDPPLPPACEAHLGLARIFYEWNNLDAAHKHGEQGLQLAQQLENIDTPAGCEMLLARMKLAQGNTTGATTLLAKAEQFVRQFKFEDLIPEIVNAQVLTLLHQGNLVAAADLVDEYDLSIGQARVFLARGDVSAALAALSSLRKQAEIKGEADKYLKIIILQAIAHHAQGEAKEAIQLLSTALAMAEPNAFIRIFVDEGLPMKQLLVEANTREIMPNYTKVLLAAFEISPTQPLVDPLSKRELEILSLIAEGLKNKEIAEELFISLNTVLYHIKNIYSKLGVNKRILAIAKAKEFKLI